MAYSLDDQIVFAFASCAFFDLTESDGVYRSQGVEEHRKFQLCLLRSVSYALNSGLPFCGARCRLLPTARRPRRRPHPPSTQSPQEQAMPDNTAIRSFQVSFPETDVTELRRR